MADNKKEILKRKKIRKLLLLKINDELKEISKFKSNIRINSKTIQELNSKYNNDILLFEKSMVYSNYITEETIILNNRPLINAQKTINKSINKSRNKIKKKNKSKDDNKITHFDLNSFEEDSASPIMSFFPKKIELGRKKFLDNKSKHKHKKSIQNGQKQNLSSDKEIINENILNKSTKIGNGDIHLYKLIAKITSIKNNESTEGIIRENIKKLREYCYKLRKKRRKKISVNKNISSRKMSKERIKKIERDINKKSTTLINKDAINKSLFLIKQKFENKNKLSFVGSSSPSPSPQFKVNVRKKSTAKVTKLNLNNKYKINIIPPIKNQKNFSFLKYKKKPKKMQTINELFEHKLINKLNKKKKSLKNEKNEDKNNIVPNISQIPRIMMRSTINENKTKNDAFNNNDDDKNKLKYIKLKNKKSINKNLSIINNNRNNDGGFVYFNNLNIKKDKVELHDNLKNKTSSKKLKKYEQMRKENTEKNEENNEEIIKLKKFSFMLDYPKKSKRKLIDSPDNKRIHRVSNFTNYKTTDVTNSKNQITYDNNNNKSLTKKNKSLKNN